MSALPVGFPKATKNIKPTANERNSQWVLFTNALYQLPLVARTDKYEPTFNEDGSVSLNVIHADNELADLVNKFLATAAKVENGEILATLDNYSDFIRLVRRLLTTNYDMPDSELKALLTLTPPQFGSLFGEVLKHVRSK